MGARDADNVMAEIFDEALKIHRNECLVFDNENIRCDFSGHLTSGRIGQCANFADMRIEDESDFLFRKSFERQQQEALARQRRDVRQPALRRHRQRDDIIVVIHGDGIPDLREQTKQTRARSVLLVEQRLILQQRFKHCPDIGIAGRLISRQRTGIAPQQR